VEEQVAVLHVGTKGILTAIPVNRVKEFEAEFVSHLNSKHKDLLNNLAAGKYSKEITEEIENAAKEVMKAYIA
jgi:F-type H+-transporting ATPase subunit alpha